MTNQTTEDLEFKVNSLATAGKFIVSRNGSTYTFDAMDNPGNLVHKDIVITYARNEVIGGGTIQAGSEGVESQRTGYVYLEGRSTDYGQVPVDILKRFGRLLKEKYELKLSSPVTEVCYISPHFEKTDLLDENRENSP
ncbi:MAG TPA: hypothetical protein VJK03_00595 [Candidatus Nanoarchaeia archaeon]|nr:hypothetical protein [Candidatus Nanoarchaeia archaeon]